MRAAIAVIVSGLCLLAPERGEAKKPPRPEPKAKAPEASAAPALPACACRNVKDLQKELALAISLKVKFKTKAAELREKYGEKPSSYDLAAARRDFQDFTSAPTEGRAPAEGSARSGLSNSSAIEFRTVGAALRWTAANQGSGGIPEAMVWDKQDRRVPDLQLRKKIEEQYSKAGKNLCDYENVAALDKATQEGSACAGIARALRIHEDSHQATCKRLGFYAFSERLPLDLANDEVDAYEAQIKALTTELERVLNLPNTKIVSGSTSPDEIGSAEVICKVAFNVSGQIDDLRLKDKVCDAEQPFTVKTTPNVNMSFTPTSATAGTYTYNGRYAGVQLTGSGGYVLSLKDGKGSLTLDGSGKWFARHPRGTFSKSGPETLTATELPEGCS
jgi:hypothetical protein